MMTPAAFCHHANMYLAGSVFVESCADGRANSARLTLYRINVDDGGKAALRGSVTTDDLVSVDGRLVAFAAVSKGARKSRNLTQNRLRCSKMSKLSHVGL